MDRRDFIYALGFGSFISFGLSRPAYAAIAPRNTSDILDNIDTRRSVRSFSNDPVSDQDLEKILMAAMASPSALNEQPWEFIVITDKNIKSQIKSINKYASFAANAPLSILVCLNKQKEKAPGMGVIDVSMCAQNILLAAHALGLGAVFTGIYPEKERMEQFQQLVHLPDDIIPIGLIVLGHPKNPADKSAKSRYNLKAIHHNSWQNN